MSVIGEANFILTGLSASGEVGSVLIWSLIPDAQNPNYVIIDDNQTPNYNTVTDSQTPNWDEIAA